MTERWINFAELKAIVSGQVGSKALAIGEIKKLLRSGELRSLADRSDIYDLTGKVLRTYEHELDASWWLQEKLFRRDAITNQITLNVPGRSAQIIDGKILLYDPFAYDNIRFWYSDLVRIYQLSNDVFDREILSDHIKDAKTAVPLRRRGPEPRKRERIKAEMRALPREELMELKQEAMAEIFKASRDTCEKARNQVLSEFVAE